MAIVKSKLLKQLANNYPNFLQKDLSKFTDIILHEIKRALKRARRKIPKVPKGSNILKELHKKYPNLTSESNWQYLFNLKKESHLLIGTILKWFNFNSANILLLYIFCAQKLDSLTF